MKCLKRFLAVFLLCALFRGACAQEVRFAPLNSAGDALFLEEGVEQTEASYRSANIFIQMQTQRIDRSDVYIAHVYLRTLECLQRSFGGKGWGRGSEKVAELAQKCNAVLALTGDNGQHLKAGYVVGNGEVLRGRGNNKRDLCVLYTDGTMQTHYAKVDHKLIAQQAAEGLIWQTFVFGPALLDEKGKAFEDFSYSDVRAANPRAVIGYFEPGHYCLVQIDGRGTQSVLEPEKTNKGMTLEQTAQLMESLGCKAAYNLDGGQSASMYFGSDIISTPYHNGRAVGDAIVICDVQETAAHSEIYEVSEFEVTD